MYISAEDWRRGAFRVWMRTGQWFETPKAGHFDVKYNPWHDERNGRFTFAGAGNHDGSSPPRKPIGVERYFGGAGSSASYSVGGSGGGAGATGTWNTPILASPSKPSRSLTSHALTDHAAIIAVGDRQAAIAQPRIIQANGYRYVLGPANRTEGVSGTLTVGVAAPRSRTIQARAGGADRRPTDDGGHYIAQRFNGPSEAFNHFAQDSNFNRGTYRALEQEWATAKRKGKDVEINIVPEYIGASQRPSEINIWFTVDGHPKSLNFSNDPKGRRHGKR